MDLRRLRHFVVLAETLNFRRAAERLHMAQPPLSVSIQKLEAELGTPLFVRDARGVALTPSGHAALIEARRVLFHANQFADVVRATEAGIGGSLRVGFVGSTTYGLLPRVVRPFRAEYPGVELILQETTSNRIMQRLRENSLDLGLVRTPIMESSEATLLMLERDHFVAALPRANPLAEAAELRMVDLAEQHFIMYTADGAPGLRSVAMTACEQAGGFLPRVTQDATQIHTVLALVESGLGVGLVPSIMQRFTSERMVLRTIADYPASAAIGLALAYRPEQETAAARHFREVAMRSFPPPSK